MGRPVFSSVFAEQMDRYLEAKVSAGFKETSFYTFLRSFDSYCARENILEKALTKEEVQQQLDEKVQELADYVDETKAMRTFHDRKLSRAVFVGHKSAYFRLISAHI